MHFFYGCYSILQISHLVLGYYNTFLILLILTFGFGGSSRPKPKVKMSNHLFPSTKVFLIYHPLNGLDVEWRKKD